MSKSYRDKPNQAKKRDDFKSQKRLKPYSSNGAGKFELEQSDSWSFANKEIVKNANRSLKKGVRQNYKKQVQNELNNLGYA
mgnify:FL=1